MNGCKEWESKVKVVIVVRRKIYKKNELKNNTQQQTHTHTCGWHVAPGSGCCSCFVFL